MKIQNASAHPWQNTCAYKFVAISVGTRYNVTTPRAGKTCPLSITMLVYVQFARFPDSHKTKKKLEQHMYILHLKSLRKNILDYKHTYIHTNVYIWLSVNVYMYIHTNICSKQMCDKHM